MLEEKNNHEQDSTDQELDDLLKDFREQDDLHARIQQFKKKKAAAVQKRNNLCGGGLFCIA